MIGLMGAAGAGKDTAAAVLVEMGYGRVAFADKLREALLAFDPFVAVTDAGDALVRLSVVIAEFGWDHAKRYMPEVRRIQQVMGTEVGRQFFGTDVWTRLGMQQANSVMEAGLKPVFTDVRFPEEHAAIRASGGAIWLVERPDADGGARNGHVSEEAWRSLNYDARIVNDSSIDNFRWTVRTLEQARQTAQALLKAQQN